MPMDYPDHDDAHLPTTNLDPTDVETRLDALEARLRTAEAVIALLNDRLAWAEAELAEQAPAFVPPVSGRSQLAGTA